VLFLVTHSDIRVGDIKEGGIFQLKIVFEETADFGPQLTFFTHDHVICISLIHFLYESVFLL
jgi:hypothetical protein